MRKSYVCVCVGVCLVLGGVGKIKKKIHFVYFADELSAQNIMENRETKIENVPCACVCL